MDSLYPHPHPCSPGNRTVAGDELENGGAGVLWMSGSDDDHDDDELYDAVALLLLLPISYDTHVDQESHHPLNNHRLEKKKRVYNGGTAFLCDKGFRVLPRESLWYINYVKNPRIHDTRFCDSFRRRFRLPHRCFVELNNNLEIAEEFSRWHDGVQDAMGRKANPISLLLLTTLRYLGRAWTLDDLSENTGMSSEVCRNFLHAFLEYGSTVLYDKYVRSPTMSSEAQGHMAEYGKAGLPGAVGSTDATHVPLERVHHRHRQAHLGFKMCHTARTYNITVNHRRRILSTTNGHPARWNDKTLALFDPFMHQLHAGEILDDVYFDLYDRTLDGNVTKQKYRGAWLIVDNGYHNWSITVPPIKTSTSRAEIRFSAWLESLRKDVECTFGILKGRWRILKSGVRVHGTSTPDKVFLTCCALHNWLLEVDGLDDNWENGVQSFWEADNDDRNSGNVGREQQQDELPDAIFRLHNPDSTRMFGETAAAAVSGNAPAEVMPTSNTYNPRTPTANIVDGRANDSIKVVRSMSLSAFRSKLVTHFNIAYERNEVIWPRRFGNRVLPPPMNI